MKITKEDKVEIERLTKLKSADMTDKHSAQEMIRRYIDNGAKYCMTCDPSIRAMFKRLNNWWLSNKDKK